MNTRNQKKDKSNEKKTSSSGTVVMGVIAVVVIVLVISLILLYYMNPVKPFNSKRVTINQQTSSNDNILKGVGDPTEAPYPPPPRSLPPWDFL